MTALHKLPRSALESEMVGFQRSFLGGKHLKLEAFTTGGGTRSINLAIESIIARVNAGTGGTASVPQKTAKIKVLCGNPHLAVERAERRFEFTLQRVDVDGALNVGLLREAITDLDVAAVYTQTLSYTDGITDPLTEIYEVVKGENQRRAALAAELEPQPITIINDSCLAFSVLVHNEAPSADGQHKSMRMLDIAAGCDDVPLIVCQDAHKHLGTDKGISTVIGTPGTLSHLDGHLRVGAQPRQADLVRAVASMRLVGASGYVEMYRALGAAVDTAVKAVEAAGVTVVHKQNRVRGSTVFSVEDPSGIMHKKLKKRGHTTALLYNLCRHRPDRTQTGWQLSVTPYALRMVPSPSPASTPLRGSGVEGGAGSAKEVALDVFLRDVAECHKEITSSRKLRLIRSMFKESSLLCCLLLDHIDPFVLTFLPQVGVGHTISKALVRCYFLAQLDSGVANSAKRKAPLKTAGWYLLALFVAVLALRRRLRAR